MKRTLLALLAAFPAAIARADSLAADQPSQPLTPAEQVTRDRIALRDRLADAVQTLPERLDLSEGQKAALASDPALEGCRRPYEDYMAELNGAWERMKSRVSGHKDLVDPQQTLDKSGKCAVLIFYRAQGAAFNDKTQFARLLANRAKVRPELLSQQARIEASLGKSRLGDERARQKLEKIKSMLCQLDDPYALAKMADAVPAGAADDRAKFMMSLVGVKKSDFKQPVLTRARLDRGFVPDVMDNARPLPGHLSYGQVYGLIRDSAASAFGRAQEAGTRLLTTLTKFESNFNPRAQSNIRVVDKSTGEVEIKHAVGLMQVRPEIHHTTAQDMRDPLKNIHKGVGIFRFLLEKYSGKSAEDAMLDLQAAVAHDAGQVAQAAWKQVRYGGYDATSQMTQAVKAVILALAAYNAGEYRVDQFLKGRSLLPAVTRAYVLNIMNGFIASYRAPEPVLSASAGPVRAPALNGR